MVSELWRYPVKSMRGDRVGSAEVSDSWGVPGDRGWALRDEQAAEIRGAKRINSLLHFHARYLAEPRADETPDVEITFPDDSVMRSSDDRIHAALSAATGRQVTLWPRQPCDDDNTPTAPSSTRFRSLWPQTPSGPCRPRSRTR